MMSYTPKHAKPASLKDVALAGHHGLFPFTESATGRHARTRDGDGRGGELVTMSASTRDEQHSKAA